MLIMKSILRERLKTLAVASLKYLANFARVQSKVGLASTEALELNDRFRTEGVWEKVKVQSQRSRLTEKSANSGIPMTLGSTGVKPNRQILMWIFNPKLF